ncbi:MAG TPA: TIGR03435 family protein [Bryobacteraceae bacterium]|jgi:uncharacterized protein (TIGR03435 family)
MNLRNVLLAAALMTPLFAQPHFEVATIKPSGPPDFEHCSGDGPSPGRMSWKCATMGDLIQQAYGVFANGAMATTPKPVRLLGEPRWFTSEPFSIEAKAEGAPPVNLMAGPMLQSLLEDRFQLKVHRETHEQQPVYSLTVAKSGLKIRALTETCKPLDLTTLMQRQGPPPADTCASRQMRVIRETTPPSIVLTTHAMTMSQFADTIAGFVDRPVLDKTGVAGIFDFRLEYSADRNSDSGPSVFSDVQQLGLRLESDKGPVEFLVIDHVEKPSEN